MYCKLLQLYDLYILLGFEWGCFKWTPVWCYSCARSCWVFLCHNFGR